MDLLIENADIIRPLVFFSLLIILACGEFLYPLAKRKSTRLSQWFINLSIILIDSISLTLIMPILAVGVASYASYNGIGFFNIIDLPSFVTILLSLLLLDLLIYTQHFFMHKIPLFWSVHRMHHTEIALDVSSAVRFHPIEIIFSMLIKMLFVLILGVPVVAVIIFEILLNALALFNHSNLKLPKTIELLLRKCIVTPEVHWIHHSEFMKETNSNYGFNLIFWDKLFSTYIDKPMLDHAQMRQGLTEFGLEKSLTLYQLLMIPFRK